MTPKKKINTHIDGRNSTDSNSDAILVCCLKLEKLKRKMINTYIISLKQALKQLKFINDHTLANIFANDKMYTADFI